MSEKSDMKASLRDAISAADQIISKVSLGSYKTVALLEADIAAVRTTIQALLPQVSSLWGIEGNPTIVAFRELAARLLDLRPLVDDALATITLTTTRETSLIELAVERYGDWSRWTDLSALNPQFRDPSRVLAGTQVVCHVR